MQHMIYFAITQSILYYEITAWDDLENVENIKILTAQKSITKIIKTFFISILVTSW